MKNLLFPRGFQFVGWVLFVPALVLGVLVCFGIHGFYGITETVVNDAIIIGITLGSLFIVCSKERHEDEMTRALRLSSLLNSIYVYAAILIAATLSVNGLAFYYVMLVNLALLPLIFVVIFRMEMHRYYKENRDEE